MKNIPVLPILMMTILLAACAGKTDSPSLAGSSWKLVNLGDQPALPDTTATLTFDKDGQASGNASCNSFGGPYEVKDDTLTFGPLMSTMMACLEPGVMEQEAAYLEALAQTASYSVTGERLAIFDDNGSILAEFAKEQAD